VNGNNILGLISPSPHSLTALSVSSVSLGAAEIEYSEIDFLKLPPPILPFIVPDNGYVLRCRAARPPGAWYPKDVSPRELVMHAPLMSPQRRYVDASVQTDDPNSTLTEIDPDVLIEDRDALEGEVNIRKRKRM
jgi:hypothetical protein